MSIVVKNVRQNILNMKTRMPFRFGIVTMTEAPHLFLTAQVEVDGVAAEGVASDGLLPKWFTKNPASFYKEEIEDMFASIRAACDTAIRLGARDSVFGLWYDIYREQQKWGDLNHVPGLLSGFGVSLIERAAIDGFCKARGVTLREALQKNLLGIELGKIHPELSGYAPGELLSFDGVAEMYARHTVGMTDYLHTRDIPKEDRVEDGLPQSLEECVRAYGLKRFKIKLSGDIARDTARLSAIAGILQENHLTDYAFTLDGNENFEDARDFVSLWEGLLAREELSDFLKRLIFVEQPVKRTAALSQKTGEVLKGWAQKPPMIIDESDSGLESLPLALERGYEGISHKNCKGVFKGVANACLLTERKRKNPDKTYLISGEDLVNVGPVALLQDLTVASLLGITHIERNGHHYFKGLSMYPQKIWEQVLSAHGDLYGRHPLGFPALDVREGKIRVDSLLSAPFGYGFAMDASVFTPKEQWRFESLQG